MDIRDEYQGWISVAPKRLVRMVDGVEVWGWELGMGVGNHN